MLNLQTITEELGTVCNGRAWVVVTSQEDIDAVLGELPTSRANDFSKIQGRFKTRLSLSSANVDEVIQERLLAKVDEARPELEAIFAEKGDILRNQLTFTRHWHDLQAVQGRRRLHQELSLRPVPVPAGAEDLRGDPQGGRDRPAPCPGRAVDARRLPVRRQGGGQPGNRRAGSRSTASTRPSRAFSTPSVKRTIDQAGREREPLDRSTSSCSRCCS